MNEFIAFKASYGSKRRNSTVTHASITIDVDGSVLLDLPKVKNLILYVNLVKCIVFVPESVEYLTIFHDDSIQKSYNYINDTPIEAGYNPVAVSFQDTDVVHAWYNLASIVSNHKLKVESSRELINLEYIDACYSVQLFPSTHFLNVQYVKLMYDGQADFIGKCKRLHIENINDLCVDFYSPDIEELEVENASSLVENLKNTKYIIDKIHTLKRIIINDDVIIEILKQHLNVDIKNHSKDEAVNLRESP